MMQEQIRKCMGLFVMFLFVVMPLTSASAMAVSVQITKNTGEANVPEVIDAQGDVWRVEALITGLGAAEGSGGGNGSTINAQDVHMKIGENEESFTSCSSSPLGILCQYASPLQNGVAQGTYTFTVLYNMFKDVSGSGANPSATGVVAADGSGPSVSTPSVVMAGEGKIHVDFTVNDLPVDKNAGLKSVEILDADSGVVLFSVSSFENGKDTFSFANDGGTKGIVSVPWKDEGLKRIKVRAVDRLGHVTASPPVVSFMVDYVKPVILDSTLEFSSLGKFMGSVIVSSDISIDINEKNLKKDSVIAYSDQAGLSGQSAQCDVLAGKEIWHCVWKKVEIKPVESISIKIAAEDESGNVVEKVISKSFTKDTSAPVVTFFGLEQQFEDRSYYPATGGERKLVLQVKEQGAGMSIDGVRANLKAFGRGITEMPENCSAVEGTFSCYWMVNKQFGSDDVVHVGLSKFVDGVGNEGKASDIEIVVDKAVPKVVKAEFYGVSDVGDKEYFQSNDKIKLKLTIAEENGIAVLVNMNDLVMDAQNQFPVNSYTQGLADEAGWQLFTPDLCVRDKEKKQWTCELLTTSLRSGPDSDVAFDVLVVDTAGNVATWDVAPKHVKTGSKGKGNFKIDLLGVSSESTPDYWEVSSVKAQGGDSAFIDLDTTSLTYTRLPFEVDLSHKLGSAKALNMEMIGCEPKGGAGGLAFNANKTTVASPTVSRALLYGGKSAIGVDNPKPIVVLEFEPFDGRKMFSLPSEGEFEKKLVEYECSIKIYSAVGSSALKSAEIQKVSVKVPFAFSTLGANDENLDALVKQAKEDVNSGVLQIGRLQKYMKWIDYGVQTVMLVKGVEQLYSNARSVLEAPTQWPPSKAGSITACFGFTSAEASTEKGISYLDQILQVLTCRGTEAGLGWYGAWQETILKLYNVEMLRAPDPGRPSFGAPARDIKENLYLSMAGLCVPGIIKNVDKYRQIKCRKVYCLQNEVKAGSATVAMCDELDGLLTCKYFFGELWYILPFSQFYDKTIKALWDVFRGPIEIIRNANIVGCGLLCAYSPSGATFCSYTTYFWQVIDYIESMVGFITTVKNDIQAGGLQYCDSVGL